jgi:hypothetical protein
MTLETPEGTTWVPYHSNVPLYRSAALLPQLQTYLRPVQSSDDLSQVILDKITLDGRTLLLEIPLSLTPLLNEETEGLYVIEDDLLNIHVFAHSRKELIDALIGQIFFLWDTYAADSALPQDLTDDALLLRTELRKRFREGA